MTVAAEGGYGIESAAGLPTAHGAATGGLGLGVQREQKHKPSGRPVLLGAPRLLQLPCVTHKFNAHFPSLPLFSSRSDFSHMHLLAPVRVQLVLLPLEERGRHGTVGQAAKRARDAVPSVVPGQQGLPNCTAERHRKLTK